MRRSVTVRKAADQAQVEVRQGERVLGQVARLGSEEDDTLSGSFTHSPAYGDVAPLFLALERALAKGEEGAKARAEIDALGLAVWHGEHDMRIDEAGSLTIAQGRVRFRPNAAYLMLRTGGL